MTKKLGSLIGEEEDVEKRKRMALVAFNKLTKIWKNIGKVSEKVRIRLYNAYVRPVLLYNSGTWGLLESSIVKLETFHRRQLRKVLGIFWPQKISNDDLYRRCKCRSLRFDVMESRWKLFGHILRLDLDTPCTIYMSDYFKTVGKGFQGRPRMMLPQRLHEDLKHMNEALSTSLKLEGLKLQTTKDLNTFRDAAQDRKSWQLFVKTLILYNQNR